MAKLNFTEAENALILTCNAYYEKKGFDYDITDPTQIHDLIFKSHENGVEIGSPESHKIMFSIYGKLGYERNGKLTLKEKKARDEEEMKKIEGALEREKNKAIDKVNTQMERLKQKLADLEKSNVDEIIKRSKIEAAEKAEEVAKAKLKIEQERKIEEIDKETQEIMDMKDNVPKLLGNMKVKELKTLATSKGIEKVNNLTKSALIEELLNIEVKEE